MALPGTARTAAFLARLAQRLAGGESPVPSSPPELSGRPKSLLPAVRDVEGPRVAVTKHHEKRAVTGWNAGLPVPLLDKDLVATGAIPLRGEAPSEFQRTGTTVRIKGFEQHPVVQACVRAIVDIAAAVPLQAYRKRPSSASGYSDEIVVATSREPAQQLVDAPNTFLSAQRFRKYLFAHHLIYGNSFTYLERDVVAPDSTEMPTPRSIRIIRPEDVLTVYVNVKGYPLWYLWRDVLGYTHTSPVQDIVHVRDLSIFSFVFGYPRGAAAISDTLADDEASEFVRQMITNSGQAGVWIMANSETTPEEATKLEAQLHEQFVRRGQRGRVKVLGGIDDIKTVAFSLDQLEFPELRKVSRESICAAFGIDPRMIGIATAISDSGLSGVQFYEARRRLLKHTVLPMMADIESELNLWLSPEFGADVYYRFDPVALAQMLEDEQATSTRVLAELAAGARTIEETREAIDLPPEFDETHLLATDKPITPVLIALQPPPAVVLGPDGLPIPQATDAPVTPGDGDTPPADTIEEPGDASGQSAVPAKKTTEKDLVADANKDPNAPGRQPPVSGAKDPEPKPRSLASIAGRRAWPGGVPLQRVLSRSVMLSNEQKTTLWKQFDRRAAKEENAFRRTALVLFGEERSLVTQIMQQAASQGTDDPASQASTVALDRAEKDIRLLYRSRGPARARWQERFHPLIASTYGKGMSQAQAAIKVARSTWPVEFRETQDVTDAPVDFTLENEAVRAAIAARAERLANFVGETTARAVTDALLIGRKAGMGINEIAKLIDRTAFGSGAGTRSTVIARTEVVGSLNQAEFDTAASSGLVAGKEWLTEGDDRVRESHYECEQEGVIPLDQPFATNGLRFPGDPTGDAADVIQCRCSTLLYDSVDL